MKFINAAIFCISIFSCANVSVAKNQVQFPLKTDYCVIELTNFVNSTDKRNVVSIQYSNCINSITKSFLYDDYLSGSIRSIIRSDRSGNSFYLIVSFFTGPGEERLLIYSVCGTNMNQVFNREYHFVELKDVDSDGEEELIGTQFVGGQVYFNLPQTVVWKFESNQIMANKQMTYGNISNSELPVSKSLFNENPSVETLFGLCARYIYMDKEFDIYPIVSNFFSNNVNQINRFVPILSEARFRREI